MLNSDKIAVLALLVSALALAVAVWAARLAQREDRRKRGQDRPIINLEFLPVAGAPGWTRMKVSASNQTESIWEIQEIDILPNSAFRWVKKMEGAGSRYARTYRADPTATMARAQSGPMVAKVKLRPHDGIGMAMQHRAHASGYFWHSQTAGPATNSRSRSSQSTNAVSAIGSQTASFRIKLVSMEVGAAPIFLTIDKTISELPSVAAALPSAK